jgi:aryl-alcohol dehydrogenase-like predicted oxidoreductase
VSDLPTAILGRTGMAVTRISYGAREIGRRPGFKGRTVTPEQSQVALAAVLDSGINLIDTAPEYGHSEELLGQYLSGRRKDFVVISKCGCAVGLAADRAAPHDYSRANIRAGVEQSLRRLRTDYLDMVQLHMSPSRAELERNDSLAAFDELRQEGKIRFVGMSGVLPELTDHIAMKTFDAFQIPYSALDRAHEAAIHDAAATGAGTIIRGAVARGLSLGARSALELLPDDVRAPLLQRRALWDAAKLDEILDGMSRMEFMLRFVLSHPDMTTTIVGTSDPIHLAENIAAARKGGLAQDQYREAKRRLDQVQARHDDAHSTVGLR